MQAVSVHVVDIAYGKVARGMKVENFRVEPTGLRSLVLGQVGDNGLLEGLAERETLFEIGQFELHLHVADYYRDLGVELPKPAFIEVQLFRFSIFDMGQHYHLPVKLSPWGLSCFRGA